MLTWGPRTLLWEQPGLWDAHCGLSIPSGLLSRRAKGAEHTVPRPPPQTLACATTRAWLCGRAFGGLAEAAWVRPAWTLSGKNSCSHVIWPKFAHYPSTGHVGARHSVLLLNTWEPTLLPGPPWGLGGARAGSAAPLPTWSPGFRQPVVQGRSSGLCPWHREPVHRFPVLGMRTTCLALQRQAFGPVSPPHTSPVLAVLLFTWFPLAPSMLCGEHTDPTSHIGPPGWQRSHATGTHELDPHRPGTGPT